MEKLQYLQIRLADFAEILQYDAHWTYGPQQQFRYSNYNETKMADGRNLKIVKCNNFPDVYLSNGMIANDLE